MDPEFEQELYEEPDYNVWETNRVYEDMAIERAEAEAEAERESLEAEIRPVVEAVVASMSGTGIAPHVTDEQAGDFVALMTREGDFSPLRSVMPHVAARAIGVAVAILGQPTKVGFDAIKVEAEKWLVARYVGDDFCGLCGRMTNHVGEH